jgi:uncharacterized protein YecE (DUF72 family)
LKVGKEHTLHIWPGTSGFSYKEWKGGFYPDDSKPDDWLRFYASKLPTVEINNTFYRMPSRSVLEGWAQDVPLSFRFVIKSTRRITHFKRLRGVEDELGFLQQNLELLGPTLGPVLFQLPPKMPKDLPRLQEFLMQIPQAWRSVVQFGDTRWLEDDVFAALRSENVALCLTDEEKKATPMVSTADWGYVRLRNEVYSDAALQEWIQKFKAMGWQEVFVFFKHETDAPLLATRLQELATL